MYGRCRADGDAACGAGAACRLGLPTLCTDTITNHEVEATALAIEASPKIRAQTARTAHTAKLHDHRMHNPHDSPVRDDSINWVWERSSGTGISVATARCAPRSKRELGVRSETELGVRLKRS